MTVPRLERMLHIVQGDCSVSDDPQIVMTTVLGSCVSCCLHDNHKRLGGMNHFLLPAAGPGHSLGAPDHRHAAAAMERLVNEMLRKGARREHLQARLYGGAQLMLSSDIGQRNAKEAQRFLQTEGIVLIESDLCGKAARRIRFTPSSGLAHVVHLKPSEQPALHEIPTLPRRNPIELF